MNSAMLSLALDPKGNTVNNERRGEKQRGGGGVESVRVRGMVRERSCRP